MKLAAMWALVGLGSLAAAAPISANVVVITPAPETAGGTLRPLQNVDVALERERVEIVRGRSISHRVVATFWLRSHATAPVEHRVALPLPIDPHHPSANRLVESFVVLMDGEPVPAEATARGPDGAPGWMIWQTSWAPGQIRLVTCIYDVEFPEPIQGLVGGTRIRYQVSTGRHWKGRIQEAIFRYRGLQPQRKSVRILASHESHVVERTEDSLVWHFTDWNPGDEDLTLDMVHWNGLVPVGYELPRPYSGANRRYDEAWLEELVERELALPLMTFPKKASALDREAIRDWIAEHLLMEIRARHGDPFIIGKVGILEGLGERLGWLAESAEGGAVRNGVRYSRWSRYFGYYGRIPGNSYEPDHSRDEPVRLEDLHDLERENAAFLMRILDGR